MGGRVDGEEKEGGLLSRIFHEDVERDGQGFELHVAPPFGKKFGAAMGLETSQWGREGARVSGEAARRQRFPNGSPTCGGRSSSATPLILHLKSHLGREREGVDRVLAVVNYLSRTYGLRSRTGARSLVRQDGHFFWRQRFPFGCSQRHALDETEPFWFGTVGSETEQVVPARAAAPAARTVLYPKQGAR